MVRYCRCSEMSNGLVYNTLNVLIEDSVKFFKAKPIHGSSDLIHKTLLKIQENVEYIQPIAKDFIAEFAYKYDVAPGLEANGYRSLLSLLESLLLSLAQTLRNIQSERNNIFFRGNEHLDTLEIYSDILHQLRALFYYAQILMGLTPNGELFIDQEDSAPLMHDCELMAKACFYGSLHGFQYSSGLQPVVHSLSTFVAQYNELHRPSDPWTFVKCAINSSRYVVSPELRGEKLEQVYNSSDVEFYKKFWSLHEQGIAQAFPNLVGATVQVNRIFQIQPVPFAFPVSDTPTDEVEITFGASKSFQARLISAVLREGQDDSSSPSQPDAGFDKFKVSFGTSATKQPKSKNLVIFYHGGGFIALTSKSYEVILRDWSKALDCPIFCVDYSLAPESPFPEAFEECFYAYAWALKHCHLLGSTAEKVVFVGDSAGGNLVLSVALRAGALGIRIPDHIVAIYPVCFISYSASPARLMSVMDPLLPLGVLSCCLNAYSDTKLERVKRESTESEESQPPPPLSKPVKIRYLDNLFKDVEQCLTKMSGRSPLRSRSKSVMAYVGEPSASSGLNASQSPDAMVRSSSVGNATNAGSLRQGASPIAESTSELLSPQFMVKLPHNFRPLKSKFCGDSLQVLPSPPPANAYMSPAFADDEMLLRLPHVDIVACEFDPLFDDSIIMAKRLESLKKPYRLHVVRQLPHGFLNFQVVKEARDASALCLHLVREGLMTTPL